MSVSASRRADKDRMKARARRLYPGNEKPQKYADHLAVCSCAMCGNPRRFRKGEDKLTLQERRRDDGRRE